MGNEHLQRFVGADAVFLDTTYCKSKHQFPPQACLTHPCESLLIVCWSMRCLSYLKDYGVVMPWLKSDYMVCRMRLWNMWHPPWSA